MTEGDKGDVRCRGWWAASGDFAYFGWNLSRLQFGSPMILFYFIFEPTFCAH
jgi:hypothetical protein